MKNFLSNLIQIIDKIYVNPYLFIFGDYKGILSLCFHTVFKNKVEKENSGTIPTIGLTISEYRYIFEYFIKHNYKFISSKDLSKDLDPNKKYLHISFDDGYFNTSRIIPILEEYDIPSDIFVVTNNIVNGNKFWWDIVYNKRISSGSSINKINKEILLLQKKHYKKISEYIIKNFGFDSLRPLSDLDRPLTVGELKNLSNNKLISIGNHTSDHAILNNLSIKESIEQIKQAQESLKVILGKPSTIFAFPNSYYNNENLKILPDTGIDFGFCGDFKHNKIPNSLIGKNKMRLGRFTILNNRNKDWQLKMFRAGITPFILAKELKRHFF